MDKLQTYIRLTMLLGVASLIAMLFSHLALTDIYHDEVDVSLEWNILRFSAILFMAFIGSTLYTLNRALKITA